ncbi:MAG: TonB-dependent receptor [Thermodesulfobacteriota bacterium]
MGRRFSTFRKSLLAPLVVAVTSVLASPLATRGEEALFDADRSATDLTELTLEELMGIEVTSVSRKVEKRSEAASAVYVLTAEDIRRAGVTNIPDALRLVPGVQVAQITSNQWAVGIRGFASRLARSVLVLIDGRSVYDPLFAGTYWEVQDTLLDDVERIEVIRGPGGAVWGANAVNGVINIITKNARDTQGAFLTGGGGNYERGFAAIRYGDRLGEDFYYRGYAKLLDRAPGFDRSGNDFDAWWFAQQGFRIDWLVSPRDTLQIQGDAYLGELGQRVGIVEFEPPFLRVADEDAKVSGADLLARWGRTLGRASELALQVYYDNTYRREPNFAETRNTFDIDFQHRIALRWRQDFQWGLEYRLTADDTGSVPGVDFVPSSRADNLFSAFLQDEIELIDGLRLTVGSKFEHNDYSGFEVQPNVRLLWLADSRQSVWGAISRAVRTPSRVEHDLLLLSSGVFADRIAALVGDSSFDSEKVIAYELGYRVQAAASVFVGVSAFINDYDDLLTFDLGPEVEVGDLPPIVPLIFRNGLHGETYGVEVTADAEPIERLRVSAAYSYLVIDLHGDPDRPADQFLVFLTDGSSPQHQFNVRSTWIVPDLGEVDGVLRYVDRLPALDVGSYVGLDLRLSRRVAEGLELSLIGRNLVEAHHREFAGGTEVERSGYLQVRAWW